MKVTAITITVTPDQLKIIDGVAVLFGGGAGCVLDGATVRRFWCFGAGAVAGVSCCGCGG